MLDALYHALDPVAFSIGPFVVRWYGLGYIAGIAAGMYLVPRIVRRWKINISLDNLLTLAIVSAVGIILGGRLGYVFIYNWDRYANNLLDIFMFSNGGMSFHGGVIGMLIAVLLATRITRIPLLTLADLIVIVAPVGICLVRIANFINGELWGAVTDLPWGVVFDDTGGGLLPRHPTQLYEALLEGLVLFIVLYLLSRKKPPLWRGTYLGLFFVLYGVFRVAIEFVRQPDTQIGYLAGGWLTMGMVLSIPMVLIGVALILYARRRKLPQQGAPLQEEPLVEALDAKNPGSTSSERAEAPAGDADKPATGSGKPEAVGREQEEPSVADADESPSTAEAH
jgi:phosphatidylglycerol:prolipoprotein diacylglycerol transferase